MRTTESSWTSTPSSAPRERVFALTTASPLAHRTIASLARANVVVNQRIGTHSTLSPSPAASRRVPRASQHHSHRAIVKTSLAVVRARVSIATARDAMTTTSRVEDASTASASASLLRGGDARASRHHRGPAVDLVVARACRALGTVAVGLGAAMIGVQAFASSSGRESARGTALGVAKGVNLLVGETTFPRTTKLVPTDGEDGAYQRARENWNLYHVGGDADLRRAPAYDFEKWPTNELSEAVLKLRAKDAAAYDAFDAVHVEFDRLKADMINARKDIGPSLGALHAWIKAKEAGESSMITATKDAYINSHCGPPNEFDSFILSFLLRGPKKWDVLFLDRGERGVNATNWRHPEAVFTNKAWEKPYVLYKNTAAVVGESLPATFFMVSKSFLTRLDANLKAQPLTSVDWWLNRLCETEALTCFSYTAENWYDGLTSERKSHAVEPTSRAPIVDVKLQQLRNARRQKAIAKDEKYSAAEEAIERAANAKANAKANATNATNATTESATTESKLGATHRPELVAADTRVLDRDVVETLM